MSIPVTVSARRIFDDRVDLAARSVAGVPVTLRLSTGEALALAVGLIAATSGAGEIAREALATLDHPPLHPTLPPAESGPPAPP